MHASIRRGTNSSSQSLSGPDEPQCLADRCGSTRSRRARPGPAPPPTPTPPHAAESGRCGAADGRSPGPTRPARGRCQESGPARPATTTGPAAGPSTPRKDGPCRHRRAVRRPDRTRPRRRTGRRPGSDADAPPLRSAMNTRRAATCRSPRRSPSTSQRRSPPSSMASTIARSRCVRSDPVKTSTSVGSTTRGSVRGARISGTPRTARWPPRRVARPRGTGFVDTAPQTIRWS